MNVTCVMLMLMLMQSQNKVQFKSNTSSDSKKVAIVFFVVQSLSNLGKSMSMTKLTRKIGFKIFPDFEVPWKKLKNNSYKQNLPTLLLFWPKQSLFTIFKSLISLKIHYQFESKKYCYQN
jgi:hypothetical protein